MAQRAPQLDLVAIGGALDGVRTSLRPESSLVIGRSGQGLQVPDPLVSIQHAQILYEEGTFWVMDLDSATGTFVDGVRLDDQLMELRPGMILRVGETELEVVHRRAVRMVEAVAIGLPLLVAMVVVLMVINSTGRRATSISLGWSDPIHRGSAVEAVPQLGVPDPWMRNYGMNIRDLRIRRVTDFDENGRDEVWLRWSQREFVVTFDEQGRWVDLGEIPLGCTDLTSPERRPELPALNCPGLLVDLQEGRYRPAGQDGLVVWLKPLARGATTTAPEAEAKPPPAPRPRGSGQEAPVRLPTEAAADALTKTAFQKPHRFGLRSRDRLSGFLASQGVEESIHYLICEEALPGVTAQVLTASGRLLPLNRGCGADVALTAPKLGRVAAIAFTATGHRALLEDVKTFYGGNPEGIYLNQRTQETVRWLTQDPGYPVAALQVKFEGFERYTDPVAVERVPPGGGRALLATGELAPARPAVTALLLSSGRARLDPPGCSELEIQVKDWQCAWTSGCYSGRAFLVIDEVGCGERRTVLRAPYRQGSASAATAELELRSDVATRQDGDRVTVLQAKVTYRMRSSPTLEAVRAPTPTSGAGP